HFLITIIIFNYPGESGNKKLSCISVSLTRGWFSWLVLHLFSDSCMYIHTCPYIPTAALVWVICFRCRRITCYARCLEFVLVGCLLCLSRGCWDCATVLWSTVNSGLGWGM